MGTGSVYVATQTGMTDVNGSRFTFQRGVTRVRAGHPLLKACPNCFQLAPDVVDYDVEAATAAPGELRGARPTGQRTT